MAIRKRTSPLDGQTSFYGVHTRTTLTPDTGIKMPINDVCMPHINPNCTAGRERINYDGRCEWE